MRPGNARRVGLDFPALGLGCGAFTGKYGPVDKTDIIETVRRAVDVGVRMIDVADFYGGGHLERIVGRAISGHRDRALIATRGGLRFDAAGRPTGVDGRPDALARACDASLRRLAVDSIDLYYLAKIDPRVPVEESVGELGKLVDAGKIGHIGLSDASAEELRRAHAERPITALASEYSLLERGVEADLPTVRALGVTLIACRPFARGLLTGRIGSADRLDAADLRRDDRRFRPEYLERIRHMLLAAEELAAEKDVSLARLAVAWLLAQPGVVPVPSTRNPLHLEMDVAALNVRLTPAERDRLAAIFPRPVTPDR